MPTIYLSPSTQEWNPYLSGGTEEEYMNLIADAMIPYLRANGIEYVRNTPDMTAGSSIRASNAGNYDLHVAIHSNAGPTELAGKLQGTDVYYSPVSKKGKYAADLIAKNFKLIYPNPDKVRAVTTTRLGEVTKTKAPAVLIEVAYHDNAEDEQWIKDNIVPIAENIVLSLTEYFGLPFITPTPIRYGKVKVEPGSVLNVRRRPALDAPVIRQLQNGDTVAVLGKSGDWDLIEYDDTIGYVFAQYIVTP